MIIDISKFPPHVQVHPAYKHQEENFIRTRELEYYALFWEMGTGKTKPLIDTITWLFLNQHIDGVLIVSDKGAYLNWENEELPKHLMPEVISSTRVAHWSSYSRASEMRKCEQVLVAKDDTLDVLLVNVESLSSERSMGYCRQFAQNHYTMMIIDEATSIKNPKAKRSQNCHILGSMCDYRRIATGTPITQGPLDLFSQAYFLNPGLLGNSFVSFRSLYAVMREIVMGPRRFKTIVGYQNLDHLKERIKPWSSRILKSECLDLPEKLYEIEHIEMTPEQTRAYETLKNEALIMLDEGVLTSTNAMTTVEKLHQICCGHVKDDDKTLHSIPHLRLESLLDLVDRVSGKVIVWCHYQQDVENVINTLTKHWEKEGDFPVHYYGKTTQDERTEALRLFSDNPKCRALVGTPSTGGKGLTLVNCSFVIYYSCGYKLEARLQSEDRTHRIGQIKNVTYIDMICPGTVEVNILKALRDKRDLASDILDKDRLRNLLS